MSHRPRVSTAGRRSTIRPPKQPYVPSTVRDLGLRCTSSRGQTRRVRSRLICLSLLALIVACQGLAEPEGITIDISGRVTSASNDEPIQGASVVLLGVGLWTEVLTGSDGQYALIYGLPSSATCQPQLTLVFNAHGYITLSTHEFRCGNGPQRFNARMFPVGTSFNRAFSEVTFSRSHR